MANPLRRQVHQILANSGSITGSMYKVCADGTAGDIYSASFGWQNKGTNSFDPSPPVGTLLFEVGDSDEPNCIEADFTYVSASAGLHVYYKSNGSDGGIKVNNCC